MVLPRRPIGTTGVEVSRIAFGAAPVGNLYEAMTDAQAHDAVHRAYERGVRWFDTAPHYGVGLSERRLGAALRELPREEVVVSTKVGRLLVPNAHPTGRDAHGFAVPDDLVRRWDVTADGVRASLEASLERLGLDAVDIAFVHDAEQLSPTAPREGLEALADLKRQGVVRAIGVGTNSVEGLAALIEDGLPDVVMLAGRYTLLEQPGLATVLEPARRAGVAVAAVGVFNSGLLAEERPRADATYDYAAAPSELVRRATRIAEVCEAHGTPLPAAAIALPLRHPAVAAVALGMRSAEQVEQNLDRYEAGVPEALWADLVAEGLLDPAAATP
ncbi:aldo/keto reductase [Amnibacterium soli]|uniref:Aldo/keto reductase n=1 Tax=Amnibacterium soli TaxID=1282736 RepID=A0ABP8Z069_9MICO